jgi:hypothetical protein
MSRNNEDRIGIKDRNAGAEAPIIPQPTHNSTQAANSPLSFVSPTEFVELPSNGKYYPQSHPLHEVSTIEIKHMTAKEEDILTSEALLKEGKAIDRFIKEIIIDKRVDPDSLLVGDKNAILVAARKSGYGPDYQTQVVCPSCQNKQPYDFDLNALSVTGGDENLQTEGRVVATGEGTFLIKDLPTTKWTVEVKPLTGRDEKTLAAAIAARKKRKLPEDMLTTQMSAFIVSIEGITDTFQVKEAIVNMPAKDSRELRGIYQRIMPNIDISQTFSCSECEYSEKMEVPFTTDFFWPKQ